MRVTVLGSGSSGNAILIEAKGARILVDAGFSPRLLTRRARDIDVDLCTLSGVVVTHEHADHARGAAGIARRAQCPVYASQGTLKALQKRLGEAPTIPLQPLAPNLIGAVTVTGCRTTHDAAEPLALVFDGPEPGQRVGIAYDVGRPTGVLRYLLRGATCLIIESNHDDLMLRTGPYPPSVRRRIAGIEGHLSNRAAADLLSDLYHDGLATVVLAHLSDNCNRADLAETAARMALKPLGFRGSVLVAAQGDPLPPFAVGPAGSTS